LQGPAIGEFGFEELFGALFAGAAAAVEEDDGFSVGILGLEDVNGAERRPGIM
jgi:hypothetical protein